MTRCICSTAYLSFKKQILTTADLASSTCNKTQQYLSILLIPTERRAYNTSSFLYPDTVLTAFGNSRQYTGFSESKDGTHIVTAVEFTCPDAAHHALKLFKIQYHVWYFECSEDEQNETRLLNVSLSPTAIFSIHLFKAAGTSPWLFQRNSPAMSGEVCWVTSAKAGQPPRFCRMSHHWPEAGRYQPVVVAGTGQVVL